MSNDRNQFTRHYQECERELYRYIHSLVPSHEEVLDVLQETANDLWQKYDQYDAARPFGVWARSFAYRRVLKHYHRQGTGDRRLLQFRDEVVALLCDEAARHAGVLEIRREALQICMDKLEPADLQLVEHRYWRSSSVRQLSRLQDVEEKKLYGRLRAIRNRLQRCIEKTVPGLSD